MNILEAKRNLNENGYCSFNLYDFNSKYFEILKENFQCNENKNFKNACNLLKASVSDRTKIHIDDTYNSFQDAEIKKNEIITLLKENKNYNCQQIWFHTSLNNVLLNMDVSINLKSKEYNDKINYLSHFLEKTLNDITKYFFDLEDSQELIYLMDFTYYNKECYLANHSDGIGTGRICAILIYLNETYDEKDGGLLILNNKNKVIPTIGNVAIINLQSFDIPHMVTKVTDGIGRYAFLSFVKRKEDEFIHIHSDIQKTLI